MPVLGRHSATGLVRSPSLERREAVDADRSDQTPDSHCADARRTESALNSPSTEFDLVLASKSLANTVKRPDLEVAGVEDPIVIISADGHAAAPLETYRAYLESKYHADLDALLPEAHEYHE